MLLRKSVSCTWKTSHAVRGGIVRLTFSVRSIGCIHQPMSQSGILGKAYIVHQQPTIDLWNNFGSYTRSLRAIAAAEVISKLLHHQGLLISDDYMHFFQIGLDNVKTDVVHKSRHLESTINSRMSRPSVSKLSQSKRSSDWSVSCL